MQRFDGPGTAFVALDGEVVEYTLNPGERLKVDTGHVALFKLSVELVKGFKNILFCGEGLLFATLTGPGRVWLQSMPMSKLAGAVAQYWQRVASRVCWADKAQRCAACVMRALLVADGQLTFVADHPRPDPPPGEALIRVGRAGIRNTDFEIVKGYFGFRDVLAMSSSAWWRHSTRFQGKRPTSRSAIVSWARSTACRAIRQPVPPARPQSPGCTTLGIAGRDGAFADYTTLPIVSIPDRVSDDVAIFVGGGAPIKMI